MFEFFGFVISLFVSVFFLLLCTGRKKKKDNISLVSCNQKRVVNNSNDCEAAVTASATEDAPQAVITINNKNEDKPSQAATQVGQTRGLPNRPNGNEERKASSHRSSLDSAEQLDSSSREHSRPQSPKGRRLPAPPPENSLKVSTEIQSHNDDEDEDPYASVDDDDKGDERKQEGMRLKVKTLDIKEGSGDSTFYAKVADNNEEEDLAVYAQVDDKKVKENDAEEKPSTSGQSAPATLHPAPYQMPEYASIDRVNKTVHVQKTNPQESTSGLPVAPPIPDRNFGSDDEDELDDEESSKQEAEDEKVPMYDKLCVRESLDHQRKREEVEKERRERYENLPCINGADNASDVYAQIDENQSEAVYESLSQLGSADGSFQPPNPNPDYSSIGDLIGADEQRPSAPPGVDLQTRPQRQHHYEQIEQRPARSVVEQTTTD